MKYFLLLKFKVTVFGREMKLSDRDNSMGKSLRYLQKISFRYQTYSQRKPVRILLIGLDEFSDKFIIRNSNFSFIWTPNIYSKGEHL